MKQNEVWAILRDDGKVSTLVFDGMKLVGLFLKKKDAVETLKVGEYEKNYGKKHHSIHKVYIDIKTV